MYSTPKNNHPHYTTPVIPSIEDLPVPKNALTFFVIPITSKTTVQVSTSNTKKIFQKKKNYLKQKSKNKYKNLIIMWKIRYFSKKDWKKIYGIEELKVKDMGKNKVKVVWRYKNRYRNL
jgi:hypothetical protein